MTVDNSACFSNLSKPTLNCTICNTPFIPKRTSSIACSSKCRDKIKYLKNKVAKTNSCLNCNRTYTRSKGNQSIAQMNAELNTLHLMVWLQEQKKLST